MLLVVVVGAFHTVLSPQSNSTFNHCETQTTLCFSGTSLRFLTSSAEPHSLCVWPNAVLQQLTVRVSFKDSLCCRLVFFSSFFSSSFLCHPPTIRSGRISASICFISTCAQSPSCKRCLSQITSPLFTLESSHNAVTQEVVLKRIDASLFPCLYACVSVYIHFHQGY